MVPALGRPLLGVLLGIAVTTTIYGPEVGVLGLALNLAFATLLWRSWTKRRSDAS